MLVISRMPFHRRYSFGGVESPVTLLFSLTPKSENIDPPHVEGDNVKAKTVQP